MLLLKNSRRMSSHKLLKKWFNPLMNQMGRKEQPPGYERITLF